MKIKNLIQKIKEYPVRASVIGSLAVLTAVTAIKDNVYFVPLGSLNLRNPQENQYVWGVIPRVYLEGKAKGSIHNFGLMTLNYLIDNSKITGNMESYGLIIGINDLGKNSEMTGNMRSYGLIFGINDLGDNSKITGNMRSYGLWSGCNELRENSKITGDMKSYSLLIGDNNLGENSKITGNAVSRGIISNTPTGLSIGTRIDRNLENYVVENKENSEK